MTRLFFIAGTSLALLSVVLGAFGAHALRNKLTTELMHSFETATHYQFMHSLALLIIAVLIYVFPDNRFIGYSGHALFAGTILFSGSIYLLALTTTRYLGPVNIGLITPLGGTMLIVGWALLLFAATKI